jgi:hypothetical protein
LLRHDIARWLWQDDPLLEFSEAFLIAALIGPHYSIRTKNIILP